MRYKVGVAYLLWLVSGCGALGFHRFYLGKTGTGILWLLTGGIAWMGSLYDFFTLPGQVREANFRIAYRESLLSGQGGMRTVNEAPKEPVERTILRIARKNKGVVTPGEVALEGDCSLDEARQTLDKLASSGNAEMRIRSSGVVAYVFAEFADQADDFVV
ncbi:MAG: TM2 domain-containing protein [Treponema sp.]|nr:TM2 domain-containing protein [Treponema sp.]